MVLSGIRPFVKKAKPISFESKNSNMEWVSSSTSGMGWKTSVDGLK